MASGQFFGDRREYDLCLNRGGLGHKVCVDIILAAAGGASPGPPEPHE